jgi:hypothetical protein
MTQKPNPLEAHCYVLSEPHLDGYRLVIGFETLEEVQAAHEYLATLNKTQCQHDLLQPNTTVEVHRDGKAARCLVCKHMWIMI